MQIDYNKYKRAFAFGCSFTNYVYPTWADMIFYQMPGIEGYNFGQAGAGNQFIACKIAEANARFKFTETDFVMVMYTTAFREDRYIEGKWRTYGNIYNQQYFDKNFVKNYVDTAGCVIRDMAMINLSRSFVESLPCDSLFLRAAPIEFESRDLMDDQIMNVLSVYEDTYNNFPATLQESMFPNGWVATMEKGSPGNMFLDSHPLPVDYYDYLVKIGIELGDRKYAEEATKKAYLANPDNSDWSDYFPEVAERNNLSPQLMF